MTLPQIPDDITRVTEAELRADLTTFIDCVAYAEDELVVMRDGQPIAAAIFNNLVDSDPEFRRLVEEQVRLRRSVSQPEGLRDFEE